MGFVLIFLLRKIISPEGLGVYFWKIERGALTSFITFILISVISSFLIIFFEYFFRYYENFEFSRPDILTFIVMLMLISVNEELFFRGFFQGLFNKIFEKKFNLLSIGFGWGVIITSTIFGLLHTFTLEPFDFSFFRFAMTGATGFIFSLAKEKTGNLTLPILLHFLVNFLSLLYISI